MTDGIVTAQTAVIDTDTNPPVEDPLLNPTKHFKKTKTLKENGSIIMSSHKLKSLTKQQNMNNTKFNP